MTLAYTLAEIVWDKGLITTALALSIPIVAIIVGGWYRVERMRSTNQLKRSMIEKGMPAAEIERILAARPPKE